MGRIQYTNNVDPDWAPHNVAPNLGLQCLLKRQCIKNSCDIVFILPISTERPTGGIYTISAEPDGAPHNVVSGLDLHCLLKKLFVICAHLAHLHRATHRWDIHRYNQCRP